MKEKAIAVDVDRLRELLALANETIETLVEDCNSNAALVDTSRAKLDAVQDYAAYYAEVASQGDAPETFGNWYGGAAGQPQAVQP
jgi:hypothetical protein